MPNLRMQILKAQEDAANAEVERDAYMLCLGKVREALSEDPQVVIARLTKERDYYRQQFELAHTKFVEAERDDAPEAADEFARVQAVYAAIHPDGASGFASDSDWTKTRLSVVITNHNYKKFLHECLDSWTRQTIRPDEIVLVDDASDEDISDILALFPDVVFYKTDFKDAQKARNFGYSKTTGERGDLIVFADSDDKVSTNYVQAGKMALRDRRFVMAAPAVQRFDKVFDDKPRPWKGNEADVWKAPTLHTASVMRRFAFEEVGGFREGVSRFQDWDLHVALLCAGYRLKPFEGVYHYRIHEGTFARANNFDFQRAAYEEIIRSRQRIAVVTLFGGCRSNGNEDAYLKRVKSYLNWLLEQDYPKDMLDIVWVDNAADERVTTELNDFAAKHRGKTFKAIAIITEPKPPLTDDGRQDDDAKRWRVIERVRQNYRAACAATQDPLLFMVEDDIEPPLNAIGRLVKALTEMPIGEWKRCAGASGLYRSRLAGRGYLSWRFKSYQPMRFASPGRLDSPVPNETQLVNGVSQGCLLMRHPNLLGLRFRGEDTKGVYGVDLALSRDGALGGWRWYLCSEVKCKHVQPDGEVIEA